MAGIRKAGSEASGLGIRKPGAGSRRPGKVAVAPEASRQLDLQKLAARRQADAFVERKKALGEASAPRVEATGSVSVPSEVETQIAQAPLSEAQRQTLREIAAGQYGDRAAQEARRALEAVQGLSAAAQRAVLEEIVLSPASENATLAASIATSSSWRRATPQQREQLCALLEQCGYSAMARLEQLCESPERLFDRDSSGGLLLDSLSRIATQSLSAAMRDQVTNEDLLASVLEEVAGPDQEVNQSSYATCSVTSLQHELCRDNPAEYARIVQGLSSVDGQVRMAGGELLELQEEYYRSHLSTDTRSPSEAMFQGACMEFANGADEYDASIDRSKKRILGVSYWSYQGLSADQQARLASQLFDAEFGRIENDSSSDAERILEFLQNYDPSGGAPPALVGMQFAGTNTPWHVMSFVEVRDGRVFLRNPWGAGDAVPEPFRVEDSERGLISISAEDFAAACVNLVASREAIDSGGRTSGERSSAAAVASGSVTVGAKSSDPLDPYLLRLKYLRG